MLLHRILDPPQPNPTVAYPAHPAFSPTNSSSLSLKKIDGSVRDRVPHPSDTLTTVQTDPDVQYLYISLPLSPVQAGVPRGAAPAAAPPRLPPRRPPEKLMAAAMAGSSERQAAGGAHSVGPSLHSPAPSPALVAAPRLGASRVGRQRSSGRRPWRAAPGDCRGGAKAMAGEQVAIGIS
jgi:hypothetical protein